MEVRMRAFFVVMIAALSCGVGSAGAEDETLKFFLSRCQYALAGKVLAEPAKREKPFHWIGDIEKKHPMTVYEVRVQVLDQYQYDTQPYPHREMTAYVLLPVGAEPPGVLKEGVEVHLLSELAIRGTEHLRWHVVGDGGPLVRGSAVRPEDGRAAARAGEATSAATLSSA
jgi:hypothetical protein